MIEAALTHTSFPVYGDGTQTRDFTFVEDVVTANVLAVSADLEPGVVINIAGGSSTTLLELIDVVGAAVGQPVPVELRQRQPGDVLRTGGSIERASELLGWAPSVDLAHGVAAQVAWHQAR
jgi:nucleoside-diphosphate-sugar epimerase